MSSLSVHVLDTALGLPGAGMSLALFRLENGKWEKLASGVTNDDGRAPELIGPDVSLYSATYRIHFDVQAYQEARGAPVFYPWADIVFNIAEADAHYHIPLLLSPFGYSTYRGS